MHWIQEAFPEQDMSDTNINNKPRSMAEDMLDPPDKDAQIKMALPWSSGCSAVLNDVRKVVLGEGSRRPTQPLKKFKMIPSFDFPARYYHTRGVPKVEHKTLNPSFEQLVPSNSRPAIKRPRIEMSVDDINNFETSALKSLLVASSLDWQICTLAKTIQQMSDKQPDVSELQQAKRLLLSAARCTTQLQKESSVMQANCILKKRDALLSLLPSQVSDSQINSLRSSSFESRYLFDSEAIDKVSESLQSTLQREAHLQVVTKQTNKRFISKSAGQKVTVTVPASTSQAAAINTTSNKAFSRRSPPRTAA